MGANGEPVEVGRWVPNVAGGPAGKIAFGPGQWYGDAPGTSAAQGPSSVLQPAGPATGRTNVQAVRAASPLPSGDSNIVALPPLELRSFLAMLNALSAARVE